jgi:hypothetical protein
MICFATREQESRSHLRDFVPMLAYTTEDDERIMERLA